MNVHEAIVKVSEDIGAIGKNRENTHQKYRFRGIDDIVNAAWPAMIKHGLTITTEIARTSTSERDRFNNGELVGFTQFAEVEVKYTITGPEGDEVVCSMIGSAADTADKAMNKALSAAAKYFWFQNFWIPVEVDDGDADHPNEPIKTAPRSAPEAPRSPSKATKPAEGSQGAAGTIKGSKKPAVVWYFFNKSNDDANAFVKKMFGVSRVDDLTDAQFKQLMAELNPENVKGRTIDDYLAEQAGVAMVEEAFAPLGPIDDERPF